VRQQVLNLKLLEVESCKKKGKKGLVLSLSLLCFLFFVFHTVYSFIVSLDCNYYSYYKEALFFSFFFFLRSNILFFKSSYANLTMHDGLSKRYFVGMKTSELIMMMIALRSKQF
jgi:hypothetical protein